MIYLEITNDEDREGFRIRKIVDMEKYLNALTKEAEDGREINFISEFKFSEDMNHNEILIVQAAILVPQKKEVVMRYEI